MTSRDTIISDFLSTREFNKTAWLQGAVTDEEFDNAQDKTLNRYSFQLANGDEWEISLAKMELLSAEIESNKTLDPELEEMGIVRGDNL